MNEDIAKQPTIKTLERVRRWSHATRTLERAKAEFIKAQSEFEIESNLLGRWITPEGDVSCETFNLWVADGVLSAKRPKPEFDVFIVSWRIKPSPKAACDMQL